MDLYEVMRTTFAARNFTDDPVPDEVIKKILDNARFAASGANRQGWRVVVRNQDTKSALASMIPLGKPVKQLSKLSRNPVAAFAVKEKFDGEVLE